MLNNPNLPEFGPLSGVKVAHATSSLAGPFPAQLMADMGADVLWLENVKGPDYLRWAASRVVDQERRNQREIALDIPSEKGREVLFRIVKDIDILIESSKGGQWANWGITDEVLWEHNPALVIVHVSGFGQTGVPSQVRRGSYDPIAQAYSGTMILNGFPDRKPTALIPYVSDYMTGLFAAYAALASYIKARETGKGDSLDIAQYEVMLRCSCHATDYMTDGTVYPREGMHSSSVGSVGTYECKDGKDLYLCAGSQSCLKRLIPMIGLEYGSELFPEGMPLVFAGTPAYDVYEEALNKFFSEHDSDEALALLLEKDIPVSKINDYEDVKNDEHMQMRGDFETWTNFLGEEIHGLAPQPKLKNYPLKSWRPAPSVGMDNDEVLAELGYTPEEISAFYEERIVGKLDPIPHRKK